MGAADALYLGREELGIEFLEETRTVDHYVKGPHHAWADVETGNLIRLWQPFNGLEVFDPAKWEKGAGSVPAGSFDLPLQCKIVHQCNWMSTADHIGTSVCCVLCKTYNVLPG